jgi:hypothetical protein
MSFDNTVFNVNGIGFEFLVSAIKLALKQSGNSKITSYTFDKKYGLIFHWHKSDKIGEVSLDEGHTPEQVAKFFDYWLTTEAASKVELSEDYEQDYSDTDVSTELGWRVYITDFKSSNSNYILFAIKPCYIWYGK